MHKEIDKVWYASYGSNILESRFLCYIRGGKPEGSVKEYKGCSDKTLPKKNEAIIINRELYFAKKSKSWQGSGVGFIKSDHEPNKKTLGRMYLISMNQFIEVIKQETNFKGDLKIDTGKTITKGSLIYRENSWYGKLLYLGKKDEIPIFTFTNEKDLTPQLNAPNEYYLKTIIDGLKESYNLNDFELIEYFKNLLGIKGLKIESIIENLISR